MPWPCCCAEKTCECVTPPGWEGDLRTWSFDEGLESRDGMLQLSSAATGELRFARQTVGGLTPGANYVIGLVGWQGGRDFRYRLEIDGHVATFDGSSWQDDGSPVWCERGALSAEQICYTAPATVAVVAIGLVDLVGDLLHGEEGQGNPLELVCFCEGCRIEYEFDDCEYTFTLTGAVGRVQWTVWSLPSETIYQTGEGNPLVITFPRETDLRMVRVFACTFDANNRILCCAEHTLLVGCVGLCCSEGLPEELLVLANDWNLSPFYVGVPELQAVEAALEEAAHVLLYTRSTRQADGEITSHLYVSPPVYYHAPSNTELTWTFEHRCAYPAAGFSNDSTHRLQLVFSQRPAGYSSIRDALKARVPVAGSYNFLGYTGVGFFRDFVFPGGGFEANCYGQSYPYTWGFVTGVWNAGRSYEVQT